MRITLSAKSRLDQDQLRKKDSIISTSYKATQGKICLDIMLDLLRTHFSSSDYNPFSWDKFVLHLSLNGLDLRKKITAPGSKLEREPVSRSKFTSKTQSVSSFANASRGNITSNVKARISGAWENSSSQVKPRTSR